MVLATLENGHSRRPGGGYPGGEDARCPFGRTRRSRRRGGGAIGATGGGMTMGTSEGAIDGMLEEEAPRGPEGMTKGASEGAPNEGDDVDMVGMELGDTEGSTDGMMVGGLGVLPATGSGLI
jgi:hypothetical protein